MEKIRIKVYYENEVLFHCGRIELYRKRSWSNKDGYLNSRNVKVEESDKLELKVEPKQ